VVAELKMYDLREQIIIPSYWNNLDKHGKYIFSDELESEAQKMIDSLVFWAGIMKEARSNTGELN
jgi:hypothetical protein